MKLKARITNIIASAKINGEQVPAFLVKDTAGTFSIQVATVALTFLSNFIVARLYGAAIYGTFTYLFTTVTILANIAVLGLNTLLIKETAICKSKQEWGRLKGLLIIATISVITASGILSVTTILLFRSLNVLSKIGDIYLIQLTLISLPLFALILLYQSFLQGFQKILTSQLAEKVIKPLVFILFVGGIYFLGNSIDITGLIWLNTVSFTAGFIWVIWRVMKTAGAVFHNTKSNYKNCSWIKAASYFFVLGVLQIINSRIDIFLLGLWKSNTEVGIYNVAVRLADFITMSLLVVNTVIAPAISRLYHSGEKEKLQRLLSGSAKVALFISLPVITILVFGGKWVLSIFGDEFVQGYIPMLIVIAAQAFNVVCGSSGYVLMMTGNEKFAFISLLVSCVLNIVLNILFIPLWGMYGTALSVAASIVVWNALMFFFAYKQTKIFPAAFRIFNDRK